MIINFTDNYQFHTRLKLNETNIQIVDKMKIFGTTITNQLLWNENCAILVKKVNTRMQLLRKVWSFGSNPKEMVELWNNNCLSVLDQYFVLWDSGLTLEKKIT